MTAPPAAAEHLRRLSIPNAAATSGSPDSSAESTPRHASSCTACSAGDAPSSNCVLEFNRQASGSKSAKRRAAEALLASRHQAKLARVSSSSSLLGAAAPSPSPSGTDHQPPSAAGPAARPPVAVPACCNRACAAGTHAQVGWCSGVPCAIPSMDWAAALAPLPPGAELAPDGAGALQLPGGVTMRLVTRLEQAPGALRALRASMQGGDAVVAIDLEWKPDGYAGAVAGSNRVALMQLASATCCVLVRTCRMQALPPALLQFLSDPSITLVGYSWDGADQAKMMASFGFGRERFARFHDLQQVSELLGYHGYGLGALTRQVLGFEPPKSRKVTMSNWEARQLSAHQIQYAALDALVTGHVFRSLRLWHASPSPCASCRQALGAELHKPCWCCKTCSRTFASLPAAQSHTRSTHHVPGWQQCQECGRATACE